MRETGDARCLTASRVDGPSSAHLLPGGTTMPTRIDRLRDGAGDAVTAAAATIGSTASEVADAIGSGIDTVACTVSSASEDLAATLGDATARVTDGAPLDDVVRRLERRWPGTDQDRYDRAFERG